MNLYEKQLERRLFRETAVGNYPILSENKLKELISKQIKEAKNGRNEKTKDVFYDIDPYGEEIWEK
jgi:hypothetical protein